LKTTVVFGGVSQVAQTNTLKAGVDILVATPGRLLDLIGQKFIELHHIEIFVLDEADRMLDMGFAPDVKRVIGMLPEIRQNMLFSATMPPEIIRLADKFLTNPANFSITPDSSIVEIIEQSLYFIGKKDKRLLLIELLKSPELASVLVFSRTKHGADRITKDLARAEIPVAAIHGDTSQNNRQAALNQFKAKKIRVLVATDIAARGIDIDELTHVVNYDLPNVPETYVHRIGRTGRAGLGGVAISFCDEAEKVCLKDIQKLIGRQVPVVYEHPWPLDKYVDNDPPEPMGGNRGQNGRNAAVPRDSRGQRLPADRSEGGNTRGARSADGVSGQRSSRGQRSTSENPDKGETGGRRSTEAIPVALDQHGPRKNSRISAPREVRSRIDAREAASESREFRGQDRQVSASSPQGARTDARTDAGSRRAKNAVSPSDSGLDGSPRLAGDRKSGLAPEEFERMARLLDGGRRRTAGNTGNGRNPGSERSSDGGRRRTAGNIDSGRSSGGSHQAMAAESTDNPLAAHPPAAARRNPATASSRAVKGVETQSQVERSQEPKREVSESPYQGRAAEQPGPFESSSFLSKPLKQRPRGV
jgi:ATP-dependent RNA helicase RhlE